MTEVRNPFNNQFLSGEDFPATNWAAQARTAFGNRPVIMRMKIADIEHRYDELKAKLAAREAKVEALRELVGNLAACSFLLLGSAPDIHELAARLEAESAMVEFLRRAADGMERLLAMKFAEVSA